jgi:hypothetical protein
MRLHKRVNIEYIGILVHPPPHTHPWLGLIKTPARDQISTYYWTICLTDDW